MRGGYSPGVHSADRILLPVIAVVVIGALAACTTEGPSESLVPTPTPDAATEDFRAFNLERDAQKLLGQANGVASRYHDQEGTFAGFDTTAARELEPQIPWSPPSEPPQTMQVTITEANDDHVVLVIRAETGAVFCEVGEPGAYVASTGSRNARDASKCHGGWG